MANSIRGHMFGLGTILLVGCGQRGDWVTEETTLFNRNAETTKSVPTADTQIELFEKFWTAYPRRLGANPKSPARAKFMTALRRGSDPEKIIAGVLAYAKEAKIGTEFVCMAATWLNQRRWEDYEEEKKPICSPTKPFVEVGSPQWIAWSKLRRWPETDHIIGGRVKRGWWFKTEWPDGHS